MEIIKAKQSKMKKSLSEMKSIWERFKRMDKEENQITDIEYR